MCPTGVHTFNKVNALYNAEQILEMNDVSHERQHLEMDDYGEFLNELGQGNFIEGILDLDEGLSTLEIFAVGVTHANTL
ncbi:MAG: hypothetical protein WDZ91_08305 [Paenibacillaceae bacterium]